MKKKINLLIVLLLMVSLFIGEVKAEEDFKIIERPVHSSTVKVTGLKVTNEDTYTDWEFFYNKDTKKFEVIYNITEDAEDEIIVELNLVQEVLSACGRADFLNWGLSDEELARYADASGYIEGTMDFGNEQSFKINYKTLKSAVLLQPGDTLKYNITIKNNSGKIYSYKEKSLVITTGEINGEGNNKGFDGQTIPSEISDSPIIIGYNQNMNDHNVVNTLIDNALEFKPIRGYQKYVNASGELVLRSSTISVKANQEIVKIGTSYYIKIGNYLTKVPSSSNVTNNNDGTYKAKKDFNITSPKAFDLEGNAIYDYYTRKTASKNEVLKSLNAYLAESYDGSINKYFLEHFNNRDNTNYENLSELLNNNSKALAELMSTYMYDIASIEVTPTAKYNNFFISIFSVIIGDDETVSEYDENNGDRWGTNDGSTTIGQYMDEYLNDDETGKLAETNSFLTEQLSNIKNEDERILTLATNLDGYRSGNEYQNYAWNWYASIKLVAEKRKVIVNFITDKGEVLSDQEIFELYLGQEYKTSKKDFEGYELILVKGNESGILSNDVEVTYIYEYVFGEGGEEEPTEEPVIDPEKPEVYTGVTSLIKSSSIIISTIGIFSACLLLVLKRKN